MIHLKLLSRPGCGLCEEMRREVDAALAGQSLEWEIVNVDDDPDLARRYGEMLPVLFVNGSLFARIRLPRLASRLRLLRAAQRARVSPDSTRTR